MLHSEGALLRLDCKAQHVAVAWLISKLLTCSRGSWPGKSCRHPARLWCHVADTTQNHHAWRIMLKEAAFCKKQPNKTHGDYNADKMADLGPPLAS